MQLSTCPACGAEIRFKSRFSTMAVCSFCQSMLVRKNENLHLQGKMAVIAQDLSILQVGTKGVYKKQSFEIIGQLTVRWQDGFWEEWYVQEENGTQAWIAQALGFFSYTHEIQLPDTQFLPFIQIGQSISLKDQSYVVSDIKSYIVEGIAGELPFEIQPGLEGLSIDCRSTESKCAYIDFNQNNYRAYAGENVDFEALSLTNLREIDGW